LDDELRLESASPRFRIAGEQPELCAGLARIDRIFVLSFGVGTAAAGLAVVEADEILDTLAPV
jgi:hypothetical protein